MTQKIEPALSAEEWSRMESGPTDMRDSRRVAFVQALSDRAYGERATDGRASRLLACIAAANHALPDSSDRKITRETIVLLRETARDVSSGIEDGSAVAAAEMHADALRHLADALESYLPPLV